MDETSVSNDQQNVLPQGANDVEAFSERLARAESVGEQDVVEIPGLDGKYRIVRGKIEEVNTGHRDKNGWNATGFSPGTFSRIKIKPDAEVRIVGRISDETMAYEEKRNGDHGGSAISGTPPPVSGVFG